MSLIDRGYSENFKPIIVASHPLQMTAQPEEFDIGILSCSIFMGMIFVLVPVSLAVDMVYDREVIIINLTLIIILEIFCL